VSRGAAAGQRVYVPASAELLRRLVDTDRLGPAPLPGRAVTDAVRRALGAQGVTDDEELEYAVMTAAALDALAVLGPGDPPRRLVVAVDVGRVEPDPAEPDESGAVRLPDDVPLKRVAAVLADSAQAGADVAAARDGDQAAVERCLDHELGWYARQELSALLDG
jgi:hypothetical protein